MLRFTKQTKTLLRKLTTEPKKIKLVPEGFEKKWAIGEHDSHHEEYTDFDGRIGNQPRTAPKSNKISLFLPFMAAVFATALFGYLVAPPSMQKWSREEALRRRKVAYETYLKETKGKSDEEKLQYIKKNTFRFEDQPELSKEEQDEILKEKFDEFQKITDETGIVFTNVKN
eukprot:gene551-8063_t